MYLGTQIENHPWEYALYDAIWQPYPSGKLTGPTINENTKFVATSNVASKPKSYIPPHARGRADYNPSMVSGVHLTTYNSLRFLGCFLCNLIGNIHFDNFAVLFCNLTIPEHRGSTNDVKYCHRINKHLNQNFHYSSTNLTVSKTITLLY